MLRFARALAGVFTLVSLGCTAVPAPPPAPPPTPPEPVPTAVEAPAPSATASAIAAPAEAPSPFHVAVDTGGEPYFAEVGKTMLIGTWGRASFLEVKPDGFALREDMAAGIGACRDDDTMDWRRPAQLFADGPDAMWLTVSNATARTSFRTLLRWDHGKWTSPKKSPEIWNADIRGPYHYKRSTFLFIAHQPYGTFWLLPLAGSDPLPVPTPKPAGSDSFAATRILGNDAITLPGGHFLVAGPSSQDIDGLYVERWSEASTKSTVEEVLPRNGGDVRTEAAALAGTGPDDLYLGAELLRSNDRGARGSFFAHWDGKRWTPIDTPVRGGVEAMTRGTDGTYWVTGGAGAGVIWTFRPPATWTEIALPRPSSGKLAVVRSIHVAPDGEVWLATEEGAVLRKGPEKPAYAWKDDSKCPPIVTARPATASCMERVFVLLYTLNKATPADYDFPLLRAAIKGQKAFASFRFAETEENHKRYFVAFPGDDSRDRPADGAKLARLVKEKVPSATPTVLCGSPRVVRELRIDVKTGDVVR